MPLREEESGSCCASERGGGTVWEVRGRVLGMKISIYMWAVGGGLFDGMSYIRTG
jgi:hypothetical protein